MRSFIATEAGYGLSETQTRDPRRGLRQPRASARSTMAAALPR